MISYIGHIVTARFRYDDTKTEGENVRRVIVPMEHATVIILAESYIYEFVYNSRNLATQEKHGRGRKRLPCLVVARIPFKFSYRQRHVFRVPMPSRIEGREMVYNNLIDQGDLWRFKE